MNNNRQELSNITLISRFLYLYNRHHPLCNFFQTSANRKQVENMAKKKLDNLMKESKIRDREDPDSFTIAALPPAGKPKGKTGSKVKTADK